MKLLLTILIPTWNRRHNLEELLAILMPQVRARMDVEVLISNNGSTDDTAEYLEQWEREPRVRVVHQPCNLGFTFHLGWLYGQATGRYLWLISDDDTIDSDLLDQVCQMLAADSSLGWIHLPHRFHTYVLSRRPVAVERHLCGRELFPSYIRWMTLISSNVIRTDLLRKSLPTMHTVETEFWPTTLLMRAVANAPSCVLPVCKIDCGLVTTWQERADDVFIQMPLMMLGANMLSVSERRECVSSYYRDNPESLEGLLARSPCAFFRVLLLVPRLLTLRFLWRVARKSVRKGVSPRNQD